MPTEVTVSSMQVVVLCVHINQEVCGQTHLALVLCTAKMFLLYRQFPIHCFVIIDGLYFLSLIVHTLAHYGIKL